MSDAFDVEELHWLNPATAGLADADFDCAVKTRYRQSDLPCRVQARGESAHVILHGAARAVTPGQYAVFYEGDECLGGGVIARRLRRARNDTRRTCAGAPRRAEPRRLTPAESPILPGFRAEGS